MYDSTDVDMEIIGDELNEQNEYNVGHETEKEVRIASWNELIYNEHALVQNENDHKY